MEDLQNQISELRNQLQQINQVIEAIPMRIVAGLSAQSPNFNLGNYSTNNLIKSNSLHSLNRTNRENLEYNFSHKDIIEEHSNCISQGDEMPCEWQVGRLTAQLTSAYERIAALEKQLLNRHLASL